MREHPGINRPAHFHWRVTVLQMQWAIQALGAIAAHRPSASGQGGRGAGRLLALLLLGLLGEGGRGLASAQPACESAHGVGGERLDFASLFTLEECNLRDMNLRHNFEGLTSG